MEAAEAIVSEIETLKQSLLTAQRQYKDSIETTVCLDEELLQEGAAAEKAFAEFEASCKDKIQKLIDESNFVHSLSAASQTRWDAILAEPSFAEMEAVALRKPTLAPLQVCLQAGADVLDDISRHVKTILRERQACSQHHEETTKLEAELLALQQNESKVKQELGDQETKLQRLQDEYKLACERLERSEAAARLDAEQLEELKHEAKATKASRERETRRLKEVQEAHSAAAAQRKTAGAEVESQRAAAETEKRASQRRLKEIEQVASTIATKLRTHEAGMASLVQDHNNLTRDKLHVEEKLQAALARVAEAQNQLRAAQKQEEQLKDQVLEKEASLASLKASAAAHEEAQHAAQLKSADKAKTATANAKEVAQQTLQTVQGAIQDCTPLGAALGADQSASSLLAQMGQLESTAQALIAELAQATPAAKPTRSSTRRLKQSPTVGTDVPVTEKQLSAFAGGFEQVAQQTSTAVASAEQAARMLRQANQQHLKDGSARLLRVTTLAQQLCDPSTALVQPGTCPDSAAGLLRSIELSLRDLVTGMQGVCQDSTCSAQIRDAWAALSAKLAGQEAGSLSLDDTRKLLEETNEHLAQACEAAEKAEADASVQRKQLQRPVLQFLADGASQQDAAALATSAQTLIQAQRATAPSTVPLLTTELLLPLQAMAAEHDQLHAQLAADIEHAVAQATVECMPKEVPRGARTGKENIAPTSQARAAAALKKNTARPAGGTGGVGMDEFGFNDAKDKPALSRFVQPQRGLTHRPPLKPFGILSQARRAANPPPAARKSMLRTQPNATPVVSVGPARSSAALRLGGGGSGSTGQASARSRLSRYRRGSSGGRS